MSEAPRDWEGQVIDGIFPLKKYLGGSDHSAVFLTDYAEGDGARAAIKFTPADRATADLVLTNWRVVAQMAHPNLLHIFRAGRCRIEGNDLLYLVMEHADEDLADILPQRALTAEEAREMLNPVLDALEYLHGKGFVHGGLKPTNILACGDQLKLSSDTISRAGERQSASRKSTVYDSPESISGMRTMAGDVWALGTTLVEVLTQKVPDWQPGPHREPLVTEIVPAPFADIARACLRVEPDLRATVADIAERLNTRIAPAVTTARPAAAAVQAATATPISAPASAAVAAASAASSAAPISTGPAPTPAASAAAASISLPSIAPAAAPLRSASPGPTPASPNRAPYSVRAAVPAAPSTGSKPMEKREPLLEHPTRGATADWSRYFGAVVAAALIFAALVTLPHWFRHSTPAASAVNSVAEAPPQPAGSRPAASLPAATKKSARKNTTAESASSAPPTSARGAKSQPPAAAGDSLRPALAKEPVSRAASPANTSTPLSSDAPAKSVPAKLDPSKGEVLDQVMPEVSAKARATIHGHVRVAVKIHVDAAGAVSSAILDSPGPSAFFADSALKAAHQWAFTPPERNGKSVESDWILHFVFTASDTKVTPLQTAP